ncbi:fumarylacetoacetate hydrolase family protein [Gemmobacter sp.]|uniref:fumarylacetoacetate hydrolase family protein n=1 Tax=Gemmobacter sp. TaxID=1898957 RepID=UPI002AFDE8A6|nr:fumarylacetoacetate hydrolase family protein [Gemmobacter sp.]
MRFATIETGQGPLFGVVDGDQFVAAPADVLAMTPDLASAIAAGKLAETGAAILARGERHPLAGCAMAPVIPNPQKVFCVGLNYHEHRAESGRTKPTEHPVIFTRYANTLLGHGQPVPKPAESDAVDYEAELALIIGKPGRRISPDRAWDHIAGYTCFNDVSMRDWQNHTHQYAPGKNFVGSGPLGPVMVTPDELGNPAPLRICTRVDGRVVQDATISDMIFSIPEIIAYVSTFSDLQPGDVIATGTPGGIGFRRDPKVLLVDGTVVEIEIERIGILRNPVRNEADL